MSATLASSAPPSPSLLPMDSSRASSPFDLTDLEVPKIQPNEQPAKERHAHYYFKDGNLILLVSPQPLYSYMSLTRCFGSQIEQKLYNVHRYFFDRDSSYFRSILESVREVGDQTPLVLPEVTCGDFDEFLAILYPT